MTFADYAVGLSQIRDGKIRGLGVTTPKRSQAAPEIPAIAEVLPGFDAAQRALASNEVRTALGGMSFSVEPLNPDEFAAYIRTETTRRAKMVKEAGIAPE